MPYTVSSDDLPQKVKDMPQHDKEIWVAAFNNSYKGCVDDGGKESDCEGSAFAIAYAAVEKAKEEMIATRMTQFRDNDYPAGQLCPYQDCCHDLAIPEIGWYKCGACNRVFYAGDTDSDYEDYRCYREDKSPSGAPSKPADIPVARDLGASWATPENEDGSNKKESRMKITLKAIVDRLMDRVIKEVDSWDGAASKYKDTGAYCSACLIDVNSGSEKKQDHCMLPVREDGDSAGTYVKQAVHAAAGGHGITQVKKPADVDQADWDSAVKTAANKIISAYGQMDEQAPDAVYELAGKEPPKKETNHPSLFNADDLREWYEKNIKDKTRAKSIDEAFWDLGDQVFKMDDYGWLNGVFVDEGKMFAVISSGGKLYRAEIIIQEDSLTVSEKESWYEVKLDFPPIAQKSRTTIQRQADGKYRWFSISCSAVLNRSGELDSRALFDSFIERAEKTGEYPIRQFFHAGEKFRIGQCDFLARDDYLLITSGVYDDSDLGRAEVRARQKDPNYWGDSIGFFPTKEPVKIRVAEGVNILAYDEGNLIEISTLPEAMAAAWYTATPTIQEVNRMLTQTQKEQMAKLMGTSIEQVDQWLEANSATRNRQIEIDGVVTRQAGELNADAEADSNAAPIQPVETTPEEPGVEKPQEFIFDEQSFSELVSRVGDGLDERVRTAVADAVKDIPGQIEQIRAVVTELTSAIDERLKSLEAGDDEKRQIWLQDAPHVTLRQTTRPRNPDPENGEEPEQEQESMADQAAAILEKIPQWGPKQKS